MEQTTIDTLDAKLPTLGENYKLAKTSELINKVVSLGYTVDKFVALKTKKIERKGYQKHRVLFSSGLLKTQHSDEGRLQILMTNSHDGTSSVVFQLGFFRFICSNGLVAGDSIGEPIRVRHIGKGFEDNLERAIIEIASRAKQLDDAISKLKSVSLTSQAVKEFELKATKLRYNDRKIIDVQFPTLRNADSGNGLFEVFNRVQEGLTRGTGRVTFENEINKLENKKIRQLKSFAKDSELNTKLFDLALSMVA